MGLTISQRLKRRRAWVQGERGAGLVEALIAVAILGLAVVVFLAALSTGSIAVRSADELATAQSLARAQLEDIKASPYDADTYPTITSPDGYTISVDVDPIPGADYNIRKITVTVSREGENLLTVEGFKVNR